MATKIIKLVVLILGIILFFSPFVGGMVAVIIMGIKQNEVGIAIFGAVMIFIMMLICISFGLSKSYYR